MNTCPNCQSKISSSIFNSNGAVTRKASVDFANEFSAFKQEAYCDKCWPRVLETTQKKAREEVADLKRRLFAVVRDIPVVSTHSPADWDYTTLGVVTGVAVMGTGIFTEISAGWADLFGRNSEAMSEKVKQGETSCLLQIKKQALETNGNAILGLDIDYSEVGGAKAMMMVNMTGTAVVLKRDQEMANMEAFRLYKDRLTYVQQLLQAQGV